MKNEKSRDTMVPLNVRVPRSLKKLVRDFITLDTHKDVSEFVREAMREKIQRDAPSLYEQLFQPSEANPDERKA